MTIDRKDERQEGRMTGRTNIPKTPQTTAPGSPLIKFSFQGTQNKRSFSGPPNISRKSYSSQIKPKQTNEMQHKKNNLELIYYFISFQINHSYFRKEISGRISHDWQILNQF